MLNFGIAKLSASCLDCTKCLHYGDNTHISQDSFFLETRGWNWNWTMERPIRFLYPITNYCVTLYSPFNFLAKRTNGRLLKIVLYSMRLRKHEFYKFSQSRKILPSNSSKFVQAIENKHIVACDTKNLENLSDITSRGFISKPRCFWNLVAVFLGTFLSLCMYVR